MKMGDSITAIAHTRSIGMTDVSRFSSIVDTSRGPNDDVQQEAEDVLYALNTSAILQSVLTQSVTPYIWKFAA